MTRTLKTSFVALQDGWAWKMRGFKDILYPSLHEILLLQKLIEIKEILTEYV